MTEAKEKALDLLAYRHHDPLTAEEWEHIAERATGKKLRLPVEEVVRAMAAEEESQRQEVAQQFRPRTLEEVERAHIEAALENRGDKTYEELADELGIHINTLREKRRMYGWD